MTIGDVLDLITTKKDEARRNWRAMNSLGDVRMMDIYDGKEKVLDELLHIIDRQIAGELDALYQTH